MPDYWINKGGPVRGNKKELTETAELVSTNIVTMISTELYRLCSMEMQGLEHQGVWVGSGHHAAQKIHAEVMKSLEPVLTAAIKAMILR